MGAQSLWRATGKPVAESGSLEVVVLHTQVKATLRGLRTAAALAAGLDAHIRLLVLEVVPYPLDLEAPRVPVEFTCRRFRTVTEETRVDTVVDIRLGRDRARMLGSALKPRSIVVIERGRWWSGEYRLARRLRREGHQVVFSE